MKCFKKHRGILRLLIIERCNTISGSENAGKEGPGAEPGAMCGKNSAHSMQNSISTLPNAILRKLGIHCVNKPRIQRAVEGMELGS